MKKTFVASICMVAVLTGVFCVGAEARYHDRMESVPTPCYNCSGSGGVRFAMGEVRLSLKDGKTIISYRICSHAAIAMETVNAKYAIGRGCCKN